MKLDPNNYWQPEIYKKNAAINIKNIKNTIDDIKFTNQKVLVCGRGEKTHPDFNPRFSTPTTDIESEFYITVDHDPDYTNFITRKGNYALSLIVDPLVPKKIQDMGCSVYWFSPEYLDNNVPKLVAGKYPKENSGLASIMLASYLGVKNILLSGIKLSGTYSQFLEGKETVFDRVKRNGTKIFSLDGSLCQKISFEDWCNLK